MKSSLYVFMKGIIDYAGLFPPAELSFDKSLENYLNYCRSEDVWMLARFVLPVNMLKLLLKYRKDLLKNPAAPAFSLLASPPAQTEDFLAEIDQLVEACEQLHNEMNDYVSTEVLEFKLPAGMTEYDENNSLMNLLKEIGEKFSGSSTSPSFIFCEIPLENDWKKNVDATIKTIAMHNLAFENYSKNYQHAGFKLRCGGPDASAIPSTEQVLYVLNRARYHKVPLKCTAGLHHPIRHSGDPTGTKVHGFVNIFGGAMLAYAHDLNDRELEEILTEEDPEQFIFTDEAFNWRNYSVFTGEITELREVAITSFGSCSFDEPRQDLEKMGLLAKKSDAK